MIRNAAPPTTDGPRFDPLLLALVVIPALAVGWGFEDGRLAFVLYREPKLVAAAVLGWLFVAVSLWRRRGEMSADDLRELSRRPALIALLAFLGYLTLTGLWGRVKENYFYEINQYALLLALLLVLLLRSRRDAGVAAAVRYGLIASLGVVTAIGGLQLLTPLAFLTPIDPEIGAAHPSVMGYKNPAALAVLGQVFLLTGLVFDDPRKRGFSGRRLVLGLLLAAEVAYLVSLRSRTSYVALAVATVFLTVLGVSRRPRRPGVLKAAAGLAVLTSLVFVIYAPARERARSLVELVSRPAAYLESDRGTYLLNTLNMVRHHPWGVGLGDWQTYYPVFRKYNRSVSFTDRYQVRRAHSDHVQFLGEAGWPGLALWAAFLVLLTAEPSRRYRRTGDSSSLFLAAQVVAFAAAMATDYLLELPYGKLQFFLVVFLALAPAEGDVEGRPGHEPGRRSSKTVLLTAAAALVAAAQIAYHASLAMKVDAAARLEWAESRTVSSEPAPGDGELSRILVLGLRFAHLTGHTKSFHKDYLLLAYDAYLLGRRKLALAAAGRALELHPYDPNALRLMSILVKDPATARQWRAAYDHVMNEATEGYAREYPAPSIDTR